MKANPDKCHFITSESKDLVINVENNQITNSKCVKLLGTKIDYKLTFSAHIDEICKKAGQIMNELPYIIPYHALPNNVIYEYHKTALSFKNILYVAV